MHILKVIHGYPPLYNAGSEVYSRSICEELAHSHQVSVFTREEDWFSPEFSIRCEKVSPNLSKYLVNIPRGKDGYCHRKLDKNFERLLDSIRPDIAHIGHLNHLSTGIVHELYQRKFPIVYTLHDFWLMCPRGQFLQTNFGEENFYRLCHKQESIECAKNCYAAYFSGIQKNRDTEIEYWSRWIDLRMQEAKKIVEKTDLFLAPSQYLLQRFLNDFEIPQTKIKFLDYGFPLEYLTPIPDRLKTPKSSFTFGYIGTHIPAKGVNILIQAFANLSGKCELIIWGRANNNTEALKKLASSLEDKNKKIIWKDEYDNKKIMQEVFPNIDILVVPSIWGENSPLVIHEAQAARIPVITANYGGMKEYVQHNVNGLLFEHRNKDDLQRKMQYALEHPQEMKQLGQRGYLYSQDGNIPSIQEHCQKLTEIYQTLQYKKYHHKISIA